MVTPTGSVYAVLAEIARGKLLLGARVVVKSSNPTLNRSVGTIIDNVSTEDYDVIIHLDDTDCILSFYYQEVTVIDERYDI